MLPRQGACRRWYLVGLAVLFALAWGGCKDEPVPDGLPDDITCTSCHGSGEDPAPPLSLFGSYETTDKGVGAHRSHLRDGALRQAIACDECHVVPLSKDQLGHIDDLPADLTFGSLATSENLEPVWDTETLTCNNTYCHGATLGGGVNKAPEWTTVNGTQSACGTCHGDPPPAPHPEGSCDVCHADTVDASGVIIVANGKHINGQIDVSSVACNTCHGNEENAAPPLSITGGISTLEPGVGAHQAHLEGGNVRQGIACEECHVVPEALEDEGHLGLLPADVTWGTLASTEGLEPEWSRDAGTCSNTYCHGATLPGGTNTEPRWTTVDGTQAACGTCHGAPPPAPHPQSHSCNVCHPQTVTETGEVDLEGGKHIDGLIEVEATSCSSCHGSEENPAPPLSTMGESDTTAVTVGAHQSHLHDSYLRKALACEECHVVPGAFDSPGHLDEGPAEVTFGELATAMDATPEWDRDQATCFNSYCHGSSLGGGYKKNPDWTIVNGSQVTCGTCHGAPPPAPHPTGTDCQTCHPDTILPNGDIDVEGEKHINGRLEVVSTGCTTCHGSDQNAAPPVSTTGISDTTDLGVGAHQAHLGTGTMRYAIECEECHQVPSSDDSPGHMDSALPAELTWGPLAVAEGSQPTWDRSSASCADSYCHGATLTGGTNTRPEWTRVDGSQAACGTCHGSPPPEPHPQSADCGLCHPGTVLTNGQIDLASEQHINGILEVTDTACNSCHGSAENAAPPVNTKGVSSTSDVTVGAHQSHLTDGDISQAVPCMECHEVPSSTEEPGHMDASPAEVSWGALSTMDGALPSWDRTQATCSNAYCHGSTLSGGTLTSPTWTQLDGSQSACGTCHGDPPPSPHPQSADCAACHPETIGPDGKIDVQGGKHINGFVEALEVTCSTCHGSSQNPAPPVSTTGASLTSDVAVGAHQTHLAGGTVALAVPCDACHLVPSSPDSPGHMDASPAELTWGSLARANGANPTWDHSSGTCANAYCHGATLPGGSITKPAWTKVDGSQMACGTCHGAPPPQPHPVRTDCGTCHGQTVDSQGKLLVSGGKHINGKLEELDPACNTCHGNSDNEAPPVSTTGSSDTADIAVGAHQSHLLDGEVSQAMACDECHIVPTAVDGAGHIDGGPSELTWGVLATLEGAIPAWDRTAATCSNTYCHGATLAGGSNKAPKWITVDGSQSACGTCHGDPPPSPHPQRTDCGTCHPDTVDSFGQVDVAGGFHVNGLIEVEDMTCSSCHGNQVNSAPPLSTTGGVSTSDVAVGAHQSHLQTGDVSQAIACTECHVVPATTEALGHIDTAPAELTFGKLAKTDGAAPSWSHAAASCSNTYCHGSTLSGGSLKNPKWTTVNGTQSACGTCHGNPPPLPHPQDADCGLCHPDTIDAKGQIDVAGGFHLNGVIDADEPTCDTCHGNSLNPAPPVSTTGASSTTEVSVGAHQSHLIAGDVSQAIDCEECHLVPTSSASSGHIDVAPAELIFGTLATTDGATPAWNHGGASCSNVYCHGATLSGGTNKSPKWTTVNGTQSACGTCHGNPPPAPHVQSTDCRSCHPDTIDNAGYIDVLGGFHINGKVEVEGGECNSCHGNATNPAPPLSTLGASSTSDVTVGAHQSHMLDGDMRKAIPCTECHVVPATTSAPGHIETSPAEVTWGTLAKTDGANPTWSRTTVTCTNAYCHGATLSGGTNKTPKWTTVNGTQTACGTCHGNPPPAPHVARTDCKTCHPDTVTSSGLINLASGKHMDGKLDVGAMACNTCHGSAANNAPPVDTAGNSTTSVKGVGAHQAHLLASSNISSPVACTECHRVPTTWTATGHADTALPAELTWGTLTKTGGLNPTWSTTNNTCSATYCHGGNLNGGTNRVPIWTTVNGTQDACGTCHGQPPRTGEHGEHSSMNCRECHNTVATSTTITGPALHVNGLKEVSLRQGGTWNSTTKTCDPACHGAEGW